jgi:hypothetical protein
MQGSGCVRNVLYFSFGHSLFCVAEVSYTLVAQRESLLGKVFEA